MMTTLAAFSAACSAASPQPPAATSPTTAGDGTSAESTTGGESRPVPTRPSAPTGELPAALQTRLQSALDQTMQQYDVPGAAVGVWIPGEGAWVTAAGRADIAGDVPVTTEMTWPLRSVTKSYTVTLILQLVDEKVIGLDDTIDTYVDGVTDGDTITLRQLADMSSGNADYTGDGFRREFGQDPDKIFTLDELNAFALGQPAQFAPGTEKVYTNANTNLLGAVVEKVTKKPFAEVLQERILTPLGQKGTRYVLDARTWTDPHPIGYAPGDDGPEPQPTNLSIYGPAGSMITGLDDARVWGETLATGTLLEPATQQERLQGAPLQQGPPYDLYALGIGETDGWWGHNGEGLGFTAAVFHQPTSGATVVVFMNTSNVVPKAHPADQLFRRIAAALPSS